MDPTVFAALALLAARQHGVFCRAQALAVGIASSTISRYVRSGRWVALQPAVYREAATPETYAGRAQAVLLALGGDAVLARWTAARLLDLRLPRSEALHVVVRDRCPRGLQAVHVHRSHTLCPDHTTLVSGLRVTNAARTLVDLAGSLSAFQLRKAVTHAVRERLTSAPQLRDVLEAAGSVRGCRDLRAVLDELHPLEHLTASALESAFVRLVTAAGLAPTFLNHPVRDASGRIRYVDAIYLPERIIIELDGARYHTLGTDVSDDLRRANDLALAGYTTVLRFTWYDVTQRPDYVIATIRAALDAARAASVE